MSLSHLPPLLSALFRVLAAGLDKRLGCYLPQLLLGLLFARGRRTVTSWFRAAGVTDEFRQNYRVVAAVGRNIDSLAPQVLRTVCQLEPSPRLTVAIDDTPTPRWGPCVEGAGIHHNPNPGPAGEKYVYGHIWVSLAALVHHPEEGVRALPLRSDLYVRQKNLTPELKAQRVTFKTKLEMAALQLAWLQTWVPPSVSSIDAVVDGGYGKRPFLREAQRLKVTVFSRLPKNASLWTLPPTRRPPGRRGPMPTYGKQRISLAKRAGAKQGWKKIGCLQYGQTEVKTFKTFVATWRPAGGQIRVVLVKEETSWRAYFCADVNRTAQEVLEKVADRGSLEETFKEIKEVWGAGQQQLRNVYANVGAFNLNGWMYSAVQVWGWQRGLEELVDRSACPWDEQERRPSPADKRRALQREILRAETQAMLAEGANAEGFRQWAERLLHLVI
jgi:DDE superfamily endonuclease